MNIKQKRRSNHQKEEQQSEGSENQNDYQKDDFVVGTEDEADENIDHDSDNDSYNSLELSEDDLQLIEENKRKKKGRLQRKVDTSDEEPNFKDDSDYREGEDFMGQKKNLRRKKSISVLDEKDKIDQEFEDEEIPEGEKRKVLEQLFDPQQRQTAYLQELDEKIISTDVAERCQLQYLNILGKLPQQLGQRDVSNDDEVQWVTERILQEKWILIKQSERQQFQEGVRMVLDFYRRDNFEAQFVITYKRYLVSPLLTNEHFWRIQELDIQWERFYDQRMKLLAKMVKLRRENCQIGVSVQNYLEQAVKEQQLSDVSDYLKYLEMRNQCEIEVNKAMEQNDIPIETLMANLTLNSNGQNKLQQILCEAFYYGIDKLANRVLLKADDLAELLLGNMGPTILAIQKAADMNLDKLNNWVRPDHNQVKDSKSVILFLQNYVCQEMRIHPLIRQQIGQDYFRFAQISTEPTQIGNREINALSYLYPIKHIKNRPVKYMEDESYLMLLQAEELDYVRTTFIVQEVHKQDKTSTTIKDDEIMASLQLKFKQASQTAPQPTQQQQNNGTRLENLRDFILRQFLTEKMYPFLEQRLREHLREQGNNAVLRQCSRDFHNILNQQPHQSSLELEQQNNDSGNRNKSEDENKMVMSLVLMNDENTRENELAKTFTANYALERKHVGMAVVDSFGELLNCHIFNYLLVNKFQKQNVNEQRDKEIQIIQGLLAQYKPDLVVISANQPECLRLRADLREQYSGKCWISIADTNISHIYSISEKSSQQLPETPQVLREAISLARFKLNPLAEVLNIWDENPQINGCLNLQFHPLQKMLPSQLLQAEYTKVACEIVNSVGVDPVDVCLHPHLQGQVQFICGLGSRKARHFMQVFKSVLSQIYLQNHFESEKRIIKAIQDRSDGKQPIQIERLELLKMNIFERNVFKNAQGFIKFKNGKNPFDRTRMTTQMYPDAFYIVRSALDIETQREDTDYSSVLELMRQPKKLDELELEEWALKKEKSNGIPKYIKVVSFMKNELTNPFQHHFEKGGEMSNRDIFYKVTQETPYTLKKNTIVTGSIIWVKEDILCTRISESGLTGILHKREFQPEKANLLDEFQEGQVIKAHVKSIDALLDEKPNRPTRDAKNVNIFRIELTLKPEWNLDQQIVVSKSENWNKSYPYKEYEERVRKTFEFKEHKNQDCPSVQMVNQPLKQQKLIIRKINHPKFKQVMLKGAIEYIESQRVGEYIIRPSSRGREFLTITWKFFEGVIVHLLVKEEHRFDNFKPKLIVGKEEYESFDEIYERYIVPCNNHMEAAANNKKFSSNKIEIVEKSLKDEKDKEHSIVPYGFCVSDKSPQYLVLMYVPKDKVEREYIKVKPEGLAFHGQLFNTLKDLTAWFKTNFRNSEYKTYMRKTKAPFADIEKVQQINQSWNQQSDIKKEKGKDEKVKYEGSDYSNIFCTKCRGRGHNANDCREKERGSYRGKQEYNNRQDNNQKRGQPTCFNCNQTGHVKKNCPQNQSHSRLSSAWERNDNTGGGGWNQQSHHQRNKSKSRSRDRSQEIDY